MFSPRATRSTNSTISTGSAGSHTPIGRRRSRIAAPVALLAGAALLAGCTGGPAASVEGTSSASGTATGDGGGSGAAGSPAPTDAAVTAALAGIDQQSVAKIAPTRLADGLVPPTNRWFSGLVYGDEPLPVFPNPLSIKLSDTGLALGLPQVTATEKTIMGGINPQIQLPLGAAKMTVTAYDTLSVTATYSAADGAALGSVTLVQGSPYVTYTAATDQTIPVEPIFTPSASGGPASVTVAGHEYGLVVGQGATLGTAGSGTPGAVTLPAGGTMTVFAAADGMSLADLAATASDPVVGGDVSYQVSGDTVSTTLQYRTAGGGPTAIVPMAGTTVTAGAATDGTYPTIYGSAGIYTGTSVTVQAPLTQPASELDLSGLSDADRQAVADQVRTDAAAVLADNFSATDTYFGGKFLYRATTLMTLADQLGLSDVAGQLRTALTAQVKQWFSAKGCADATATKCFVYDPTAKTVIGQQASFGSDEINDHHFHYGYLLYAAAVLAKDDAALKAEITPVADLLVADIASSQATADFPQYRNFDPYAGHAWASGSSPFGDGNNQESSSEAVNAWNAVALWGQVTDDQQLTTQGEWMMSTEAASAKRYWTNTDLSEFAGFTHSIVALNWGGKRDYATWFSAEPGAALGIQLIPMGPYSQYLAGDADRIKANLAEGASGGYGVQFGEYMAQYLALADPAAAKAQLGNLPAEIDNATTKAYVMAYVLSRADSSD
ncbi:1,3-beta-glucanase [Nakamurella flava]|uniref:glucan endo-1,3-beta-D-glucosidase n=1 Tax=Nakamurella flava TaxID=2576308 RepID=A0A4U6QLM3_9ACTN|nr:glycosyl hydrolase [Nakamurella flava]TKV61241.1 1,3-beta-glucanase [Nakamurella flava]